MMASVVLYSIRSAQDDLKRSHSIHLSDYEYIITKYLLKNLELFVLCARKLGNDDAQLRFYDGKVCTLASLFQRIHDVFSRNPGPCNNWGKFYDLGCAIDNFMEEIGGWYNTLLVSLPQPTSFDEVTDFIDSLLEHLNDLIFFHEWMNWRYRGISIEPIEALIEKITFLRNFIRFATLRSVVPPQLLDNFLTHIHAVAVDAAHTSFMYIFLQRYDVELNIPVLLQMIKTVDPQVDETYTQALTSSKLSTQSYPPIPHKVRDPSLIMKDFIDSVE